jgi:hypothetical protein
VLAILLLALLGQTAESADPDWQLSGSWSDACPCDSFCPCWFNSAATHGSCTAVSFFHIEKGRFGNTVLDGLMAVEALESPEGMTMIDASLRSKVRFHRVYLDSRLRVPQRKALQEIFRQSFGVQEFRSARITAELAPRRHKVTIPNVLEYEVVQLVGLDGKNPVRVSNAPFTDRSIPELLAGRSVRLKFTDGGERWEFAQRHATFARFAMDRAMYR